MNIKSYEDAVGYLESFIGKAFYKIDRKFLKQHDPLERMRILLNLLGNPQEKFKSVLVGGTSGKGSTSYLISHILTTAGYKTALTISPHLQKVNERLQINGKEISDEKFTEMVNSIVQTIELMKKMTVGEPSYFEILVAMAFVYFAKERVDVAVVEVGMGGEFDGTNTLSPLIAVLTNVSLDHTNILGNTIEKIARTKAGIIKEIKDLRLKIKESKENHKSLILNHQSLIVVAGVKQRSIIKIIEDRCKKVGAQLNLLWRDFGYKIKKESLSGINFDFISHEETLDDLKLSLLGQYQAENASLAIKTILKLEKFGFSILDNVIRKALSTAFFPGRFEVIKVVLRQAQDKMSSTLILDGAHNPTKMHAFLATLKKLFPTRKKVFIIGFKFDKDIKKMLRQITKVADEIIVTQFKAKTDVSVHASADALMIKDKLLRMKYRGEIIVERDSKKALKKALAIEQLNNETIVVVTGSLYLVGEIRNKL